MTSGLQQGYDFDGVVTGTETPIRGWLIVVFGREGAAAWPEPIGAGLRRRCRFTLEGELPERTPFHARIDVPRRRESLLIEISDVTPGAGEWHGRYEVRLRTPLEVGER